MTVVPDDPTERSVIPVVGVGASAGGLAPSCELLRHLGPAPALAVVIVHHLDPAHESSLAEILSRVTELPVAPASDGMRVELNHVYVAPPNATLAIADGILRLTPRGQKQGAYLPIDTFFESLAVDRTVEALGVVLSGTGSDGTLGIQAIKNKDGVTFAQDGSAEYRSMPGHAVATGCIDFVLSPEGIARELTRIAAQSTPAPKDADDAAQFQRILACLRKASGIDFANYKETTLRRRVHRRALVKRCASLRDYADELDRTPEEARALADEVLIHVTSFFRDPPMFDALKAEVFPRLTEGRRRDLPIRIWVPGCSTGEEVYSIAMTLLEYLGDKNLADIPVKVFGTDVSLGAIDTARAGRYPESIARDVSPGRLQRFFSKSDGLFQIRKDLRDLCVFARQDATRDPPFAGMDLISCRNLMIYLGTPLQDRILPIFHYALKEPGFLVLGSSETIRSFPGFSPLDGKNRIYTRTSAAPRRILDFPARDFPDAALRDGSGGARPAVPQDLNREADRLVLAEFGPPGVVVTDDLAIVQFRGRTGLFLEPTAGVASFDLLRMVREDLRLTLRQAIDQARASQTTARRVTSIQTPEARDVELEVIPFRVASRAQRFFVVLFRDVTAPAPAVAASPPTTPPPAPDQQLAQELASTRDYLQSVIEQLEASNEELRAANEEIVSSNEELRSTNEELQMAKEELQATNEELGTTNDEMTTRTVEVTRLNDDLTNVFSSVAIPIVILGRDARVRRFTPAAGKLFRLSQGDLGHPAAGFAGLFPGPELAATVAEVLEHLSPVERTVRDGEGRWYQVTVLPYVTLDNRIDGTVITAVDVDAVKKGALLLDEARLYAESIIDTMRECLVVLEADGRVRSANRAFLQTFCQPPEKIQGRSLFDLGGGLWNIPALRSRLEALGDGEKFEDHHVQVEVPGRGRRVLLLNARRIEGSSRILLAIEDVTERAESETKLRDYQEMLKQMAFDATRAEDLERRRIATDVHDHIGQSLALAQIKLASVRPAVAVTARAALEEAIGLLEAALADTRTLIFELSPPVLYDLGLKAALSWLGEDVEKRHGLRVELVDDAAAKPLDDTTAALVFRCVREVLANVAKHAKVATARVALRRDGDDLEVEVVDEGVGFDLDNEGRVGKGAGGFGLFSVREQLERLGGSAKVSSAPEQGTRVTMRVPIKPPEAPKGAP